LHPAADAIEVAKLKVSNERNTGQAGESKKLTQNFLRKI
jgi:hypothetical protein